MQEAVLERCALDLDVIGKLEDALEGARGDALIERLALGLFLLLLFLALDGQGVFLRLDREFILAEARDRDRNAVIVLVGTLDVVGRVARRSIETADAVDRVEQPVEADGRAIERGKVESSHWHILQLSDMSGARAAFAIRPNRLHPVRSHHWPAQIPYGSRLPALQDGGKSPEKQPVSVNCGSRELSGAAALL
jgi:hypothetical protein